MDHNRVLATDRVVRLAAHAALDLILIVIGYRLAYELRFDFAIPVEQSELFWLSLPLLVVFRFAAYANSGVFRSYWPDFGPQDLLRLALAVTLSSLGFAAVVYLSHVSPSVPRPVLLIEWASAIFLTAGIPLMAQALRETPLPFIRYRGRRTLITGADPLAEQINQLPKVQPEDRLGRPRVNLDLAPVAGDLRSRVILLTGAAGSLGSELARQIASFAPARLVLLDQAEGDLYLLHLELTHAHPGLDLVPMICDVTNATRLAQVCAQYRPDYVMHAAAYKQVELMEANVFEAVRNNVLGTLLVATTAVRYGATKVLLVSTDKAVRPSSVMGATKRLAERIIFGLPNLHRSGTDFRAVRFGNVLSSKGSVIPEAAQLVLHAGSLPESGGAITMLEMATVPSSNPRVRIIQNTESAGPELVQGLSRLFAWLDSGDPDGLLGTLAELVPECVEPLAQHRSASNVRPEPHSTRRESGAWQTVLNPVQPAWHERRARVRWVPPADLHTVERRAGLECRRKEARAGGRRRTDLGVLLPMGSTIHRVGGETATATADRSSTACEEAVS